MGQGTVQNRPLTHAGASPFACAKKIIGGSLFFHFFFILLHSKQYH